MHDRIASARPDKEFDTLRQFWCAESLGQFRVLLTKHFPYGIITPYRIQVLSFGACFPAPKVSERRCRDEQKRTPRNIDTQHEGMELHRGCPGNVDAEIAFRVIRFSITRKRILLSTSISHVKASMVLPSTLLPLVLVFPVARILTHSAPLVCF